MTVVITYKYEHKFVEVEMDRKVTCDICDKVVKDNNIYQIVTGHNSWGNDSGDSRESYHCCSGNCLKKLVEEYIYTSNDYTEPYMEIKYIPVKIAYNLDDI